MKIKTCIALALATAFSASALATTLQRLSLTAITQQASIAVVGEVRTSRTAQMNDGLFTLTTIAVQQAWWGTSATSLTIATPGGSQTNTKYQIGTVMAGAPSLLRGERAIFLLKADPTHGGYQIVGYDQGLLPLLKTAQGDEVMLPGTEGAATLAVAGRKLLEMRSQSSSPLTR